MTAIARAEPALPTSDADPFGHEVLEDPLPMQAALRDAGPVVYLSRYDVYAMARYEQVHAALRGLAGASSPAPGSACPTSATRSPGARRACCWRPTRRTTTPRAGC